MGKTFVTQTLSKPRSAENDAAGLAAAKAFGFLNRPPTPKEEEAVEVSTASEPDDVLETKTQEKSTHMAAANKIKPATLTSVPRVLPHHSPSVSRKATASPTDHDSSSAEELKLLPISSSPSTKMTIYPRSETQERLLMIRLKRRIAAAPIAEYALEQFLLSHTDEEIATIMRSMGEGLHRVKRKI